jgi:thioredoxin-dependent peroxiredoxin
MTVLIAGQVAPDFELKTDNDETIQLSQFRGKKVVLFYYPRASTSGCTVEACGFRDEYTQFEAQDIIVLGISPDGVKAQAKFSRKNKFQYPLLADEDHAVAEQYGVWVLKKMYGREYWGVNRTTFIIDEEGLISQVFEKVKPAGHSEEVLAAL